MFVSPIFFSLFIYCFNTSKTPFTTIRLCSSAFQIAIGPWPMHEVVPNAVSAAVRIDTITCITVFHVSFFILKLCFNMTFVETRHSSCSHDSVLATPKVHFFIPHFNFSDLKVQSVALQSHFFHFKGCGARPLTFRWRRRPSRRCHHHRCHHLRCCHHPCCLRCSCRCRCCCRLRCSCHLERSPSAAASR